MSHPRSFIKPDSNTNGLNPMYQSFSNESEPELRQSEYDVINDSQRNPVRPPLPARPLVHGPLYATPSETSTSTSRITTKNSIYASSRGSMTSSQTTTTTNELYSSQVEFLKHPTLSTTSTSSSRRENYRFESIPTRKAVYTGGVNKSGVSCSCSWTSLALGIGTFVSMLLSISVIVICILHMTNVVSILTTSTPVANQTIISNLTMNDTTDPTTDPPTDNTTNNTACSCSERNETYTFYLEMLQEIQSNVTDVAQELMMIDDIMEPISAEALRNIIRSLNSRTDSIHDSINQLIVQATDTCSILSEQQHITEPVLLDDLGDQTCPVNITEGHQLTSTIDVDNECTVKAGIICQVPSMFSCFTFGVAEFLKDDQILVDFTCYVVFSNPDIEDPPNGTAAIRQESLINTTPNQNIFDDIISDTVDAIGCQCLSFEPSELLSCRYIARYCNYKRGQVTSTIVP